MSGDHNPSKRPEVRDKLRKAALNRPTTLGGIKRMISETKLKRNILLNFEEDTWPIGKRHIRRYERYLIFLRAQIKPYKHIIAFIDSILEKSKNVPKKPYPKNRKSGPRGKNYKISKSKIGKKWYTSPNLLECRLFGNDDVIPYGWIKGMKLPSKIEKNRIASTGRTHTKEAIEKMTKIRNERNKKH